MLKYLLYLLTILTAACNNQNVDFKPKVEIRKNGTKFQLYRNGRPYFIKGGSGHVELNKLKEYGGNSIRTWNTQNAADILDQAHQRGLTVTLGLEIGKEWWGQEFNYWNFKQVNEKIEGLKTEINKYKDHPALLMWGLGNEVHIFGGNRILIMLTLNRMAKVIHELDPDHPVMTTITLGPRFYQYGLMRFLCPHIDLLGVNGFGRLSHLYEDVRHPLGWNKPYILSEWGPPGQWESNYTDWGAPIEMSSSEKAKYIDSSWEQIQNDKKYYLGGYAFYWGNKYEVTHTFFSLFLNEGLESESVNVLHSKWTKKPINNWAPRIKSLKIVPFPKDENPYLVADSLYHAKAIASDLDGDPINYRWELRPEGQNSIDKGNFDNTLQHLISPLDSNSSEIIFRTPADEGPYRLFVFVFDNHNHFATKNKPIYAVIQ